MSIKTGMKACLASKNHAEYHPLAASIGISSKLRRNDTLLNIGNRRAFGHIHLQAAPFNLRHREEIGLNRGALRKRNLIHPVRPGFHHAPALRAPRKGDARIARSGQQARLMHMAACPIINIARKQGFGLHRRAGGIDIEACMQNANHEGRMNAQLTLGSFT